MNSGNNPNTTTIQSLIFQYREHLQQQNQKLEGWKKLLETKVGLTEKILQEGRPHVLEFSLEALKEYNREAEYVDELKIDISQIRKEIKRQNSQSEQSQG